jgi:hypothetical protein
VASLLPTTRDGLIAEARNTIRRADADLEVAAANRARAEYARASVLIQLAGYLGAEEEAEGRKAVVDSFLNPEPVFKRADPNREVQDAFIAGRELEAKARRPADCDCASCQEASRGG